jgi:hypothetical protein
MNKLISLFGIVTLTVLLISSCSKSTEVCSDCDGIRAQSIIVWINSRMYDCGDTSGFSCFEAQVNDTIDTAKWEIWKNEICGFDFAPGYIYKLSCKRTPIGTDSLGDKVYKYCLVSVLSSQHVYLKK